MTAPVRDLIAFFFSFFLPCTFILDIYLVPSWLVSE